jgi:hypothetical protein
MKKGGRKQTEKIRKKISLSMKKYLSNPKVRKEWLRLMNKYLRNSEAIKKRSALMKKYYSNPKVLERFRKIWSSSNFKNKVSIGMKKLYKEHPELISKIDRKITEWWHEHPNIRKERSKYIKNLFIKHPEKFKKFLKYGHNPTALQFKTKGGYLVRSRGEQKIADFLFDNKIKFSYEKQTLIFEKEGQICVPDFYLPSSKTYIEFYGGFPKAWKKKVMKNKLYKKHKIKCVFITPAELRNLEYYLENELKK